MNRRDFLISIGGITATIAYPSLAAVLPQVDSVPALVEWFEKTFAFSMGAPWGFVEPRATKFEDHPEAPTWWTKHEVRDYAGLTPYATYAIQGPSEAEAVAALHRGFSAAVAQFPGLSGARGWWRLEKKIQAKAHMRSDPGDIVYTEEQVADSNEPLCLDELVNVDGYWRKLTTPYQVVTLRTRIALPALDDLELNGLPVHLTAAGFMVQAMDNGRDHIPLEVPEGAILGRI